MRHLLKTVLVLAALSLGTAASAQSFWIWDSGRKVERKHTNKSPYSIRLGFAGLPEITADRFKYGYGSIGYRDYYYEPYSRIRQIYTDYTGDLYSTGMFTGEFVWNLGRVFNASANLGLCPFWAKAYDGVTGKRTGTDFGLAITIMPEIKLMYCNTPTVRVYSSLGLGVGFYPGFEKASPLMTENQFNPLGLEVGRKFYGFGEIGVGTMYCGGRIGIGYRFTNGRRRW